MYSILSRKDHFDLTTRDMGLEYRYAFGKMLGKIGRASCRERV